MKRTLAMLLAAMLAISTATAAFAADPAQGWGESGEITGDGDVMNPVIAYQLPSDLDFALDAFSMGDGTDSQVYSSKFNVVNKSQVAIKIDVKADLEPASGVSVKPTIAEVKVDDTSHADKEIYMEVVAQEITASALTTPIDSGITANPIDYKLEAPENGIAGAQTNAKAVLAAVPADPTDYVKPVVMTLALEKATYPDQENLTADDISGIADKTGAAALRFAGTINPNADWQAGDVKVKAVFDVRGLNGSNYTALTTADGLDASMKAANVVSTGGASAGSSEPSVEIATFTQGSALTFTVNVGSGDNALATLDTAKIGSTNIKNFLTFDAQAGTLVANSQLIGYAKNGHVIELSFITAGGGTKEFSLTCGS